MSDLKNRDELARQRTPEDAFRRRVLVRLSTSLALLVSIGTLMRHWVSPIPLVFFGTSAVIALLYLLVPLMARRGVATPRLVLPIFVGLSVLVINAGQLNGGINAPICALLPLFPLIGFCFGGRKVGAAAFGLALLILVGLVLAGQLGFTSPLADPESFTEQRAVVLLVVAVTAYAVSATYEASRGYAEARLDEVSRLSSLGTMAGGIAHEINNPLTIIIGYARQLEDLAKEGGVNAERLGVIAQKVNNATHRMAKVTAGLRTYARDGTSEPMRVVHLGAVLQDAVALCGERFRNAGVELRLRDFPESALTVGHSGQITEIFLNLLYNAFDAVAPRVNAWIAVDCRVLDKIVEVSVTDSGPGIPPELRAKIFRPFFSTKDVGKGIGLGLSLTAGLMDRHGGEILLDNESAHTRFLLRFPRSAANPGVSVHGDQVHGL